MCHLEQLPLFSEQKHKAHKDLEQRMHPQGARNQRNQCFVGLVRPDLP
jgi:hypothetical protein